MQACFEYIVHLCSIACCQIALEKQIELDPVRQDEPLFPAVLDTYIFQFSKLLKAPTID